MEHNSTMALFYQPLSTLNTVHQQNTLKVDIIYMRTVHLDTYTIILLTVGHSQYLIVETLHQYHSNVAIDLHFIVIRYRQY